MYKNHLKVGAVDILHRDKRVVTSLDSKSFEDYVTKSMDSYPIDIWYITNEYEHRADLISELFYNTPTLDWLICYVNNISDPFQGLNSNDRLIIPRI